MGFPKVLSWVRQWCKLYMSVFFAHMFAYSIQVLQCDPRLRWSQGEGLYMRWGPERDPL